jgi:hypothetical protein
LQRYPQWRKTGATVAPVNLISMCCLFHGRQAIALRKVREQTGSNAGPIALSGLSFMGFGHKTNGAIQPIVSSTMLAAVAVLFPDKSFQAFRTSCRPQGLSRINGASMEAALASLRTNISQPSVKHISM